MSAEDLRIVGSVQTPDSPPDMSRRVVQAATFTPEDLVPGVVIEDMPYYDQLTAALPRLAEAMLIRKTGNFVPPSLYDLSVYPTPSGEEKPLVAAIKTDLWDRNHNGPARNFTFTMRSSRESPEVARGLKHPEEVWYFTLDAEVHSTKTLKSVAALQRDASLYIAHPANTLTEKYDIWLASRLVNGDELKQRLKVFQRWVRGSAVYNRDLTHRRNTIY